MKMKRLEEIEAELKKPSMHSKDLAFIVELCRGVRELHALLKVARDDAQAIRGTDQVQRAMTAETEAALQGGRASELEQRLAAAEERMEALAPESDNLGGALRRAVQAEAVVSRAFAAPPYHSIVQHSVDPTTGRPCPNSTTLDLTCGCGAATDLLAVLRKTGDIK